MEQSAIGKMVRKFSPCGPCITQGVVSAETAQFYCFTDKYTGNPKKLRKALPGRYSGAHVDPCSSCRDHPRTQYPNGYTD